MLMGGDFCGAEALAEFLKRARYIMTHDFSRAVARPTTEPLTGMEYMADQLREVLIMFICGVFVAFLFRIYDTALARCRARIPEKYSKIGDSVAVTRIADIFFCIFAGAVILKFWYRSSFCSASLYEALSLMAGIISGSRVFAMRKSRLLHTAAVLYVIILLIVYIMIA